MFFAGVPAVGWRMGQARGGSDKLCQVFDGSQLAFKRKVVLRRFLQ